jgi:hypothetical protein
VKSLKSVLVIGACILLIAVLITISLSGSNAGGGTAGSSSYAYGARNLIGASPEQVAQFALQYVGNQVDTRGVTPQVLLSRPVKDEELPSLGFDCIVFGTIEQPPLALVIMKGRFFVGGSMGGGGGEFEYLAYIFDVWSAQAEVRDVSVNGSIFRTALNDPSLPTPEPMFSRAPICETPGPTHYHYGDTVPGIPMPTATPGPSPTPYIQLPRPPATPYGQLPAATSLPQPMITP